MTPKIYSFYRLDSGEFTGGTFTTPDASMLAVNTPPGCGAIEGTYDRHCQRVVLDEQGNVMGVADYQSPPPDGDHEWDPVKRRWRLTRHAIDRLVAKRQLQELDGQQIRAIAELVLDPQNAEARARLEATEAQKVALRARMRELTGTPADSSRTGSEV